jgi:hypothetical protein
MTGGPQPRAGRAGSKVVRGHTRGLSMMSGLIGPWARMVVLVAALLALAGPALGQDRPPAGEIDLRPRFEKGQTIKYLMEMHSKTASPAGPARPGQRPRPTDQAPKPAIRTRRRGSRWVSP